MSSQSSLSIPNFLAFKLYCRLPDGDGPLGNVRRLIRNAYFRSRLKTGADPMPHWLEKYFHLLVAFNGKCQSIDSHEAVSAIGFRRDLSQRVLLYTRLNESSDLEVAHQIWEYEEYDAVVKYMQQHYQPKEPLRIIDAGANVGYTTLYLKTAFPDAHIVSIEPEANNFRQLSRNVALNGFENVRLINAGLWKRAANLVVGRDFRDHREWSFYVKETSDASGLVGHSVPDILRQQQWASVDLLKIDIEGAERYIFENADLAREVLQNARFVAIEIHDEFNIRSQIYEYLQQNGFEFFDNGELTIGRNTNLTV